VIDALVEQGGVDFGRCEICEAGELGRSSTTWRDPSGNVGGGLGRRIDSAGSWVRR
jgi:hypothetical protein